MVGMSVIGGVYGKINDSANDDIHELILLDSCMLVLES